MPKIYIAAKFEKKDLALSLYEKVKEKGYEISYDWTTHKNIMPYIENKDTAAFYSNNELNGINSCDVFVYISEDKGHTLHMEIGAAIMRKLLTGKPEIYAIGEHNEKSPWFFNPLIKRFNTIEEVLKLL